MERDNKNSISTGLKLALAGVILLVVVLVAGVVLLPMLQTVGGSFGYGFPSGKGGRAIRNVEIDVEPQVVYRIDDHRFFTFEKYLDCNSGGFVYYNDTRKGIKKYAGIKGQDKTQDEVSIMKKNNVLSYNGKFIYAAGDDVIAYPDRDVNYKYGGSTYFIIYSDAENKSKESFMKISYSSIPIIVKDGSIITKVSTSSKYYHEYKIPLNSEVYDLLNDGDLKFRAVSIDDHFHCNDEIKPKRIKYINN